MNILIINKDTTLLNEIKYNLNINNKVYNCNNIRKIKNFVIHKNIDILVIDLDYIDNISNFKHIISLTTIPIIVLSSNATTDNIVFYFSLGIDDYIIKPYSIKELVMRIKVISKRNNKNN